MTIEEAIVDTIRTLPPGQQQEVLRFATSLRNPTQHTLAIESQQGNDNAMNDPLAPFLGAFEATDPDITQRHDDYLAVAYADAHES
jgi:hypothetical protein